MWPAKGGVQFKRFKKVILIKILLLIKVIEQKLSELLNKNYLKYSLE